MQKQLGAQPRAATSFGAQLRVLRARAGLTQEALAERAGLGVATLKALEGDQRQRPHPQTLALLADALGLTPEDRDALLHGSPSNQRAADPDVAEQPAADAARLPVWLTSFVGRETELEAVRTLLHPSTSAVRFLTLLGPGGVGKTRLAAAAAAELVGAYADGVVFVDLAPLSDARLVPSTIARALDLQERAGRSARELLREHLQWRRVLLVLDNFEHLLDAAPVVADLVQGCRYAAVLITSRTALRVQGEQRLVLAPLPTPPATLEATTTAIGTSPAVRLFVERAMAVSGDFALTTDNAPAIADICRRLDGLPLAIELAAARACLLPPATLLARLERRLAVLTGGAVNTPPRHQTLRAALAWSVDLLAPAERALFRRLAVFAGDWSLEAAEAIGGDDTIDGLQMLVDSSLVHRLDGATREPRFRLLETVREYALEQLEGSGESSDQYARHAAYVLTLVEKAEPELLGPDQRFWFDQLDRELDNVRVALAWARSSGELELGLRLALALTIFYEERGHVLEGCEWLQTLLDAPFESDSAERLAPLGARALAAHAWLRHLCGDYRRARLLAEQSLASWRHLDQIGNSPVALNVLAFVARQEGDLERQEALFRESLAMTRAAGDIQGSAAILSWLGTQPRAPGDFDEAIALLEESLRLYQSTGTTAGIAFILYHLGGAARFRHDANRAKALIEQSLALSQALGDRNDMAYARGALAGLAADDGDLERAQTLCEESIATFHDLGDDRGLVQELRVRARIAGLQGDDRTAAACYVECVTLRHGMRIVDLAFTLEGLALVLARMAAQLQQVAGLTTAVHLLGAAAALREQPGVAADRYWNTALPLDTVAVSAQQVAATRALVGDAAFDAAWNAGRQLSLEQACAEALAATATVLTPDRGVAGPVSRLNPR
jgi:predicted ATPase/transcriptional regulator with XRE-family HTH domain